MIVMNGGPGIEQSEAVLFPYDDRSIPFRYRLQIGQSRASTPTRATASLWSGAHRVLPTAR